MPDKSPGQVSRMLKRLWMHNFIRKVGRTYKYYITEPGRTVITMALKLKELVLIPELARALAGSAADPQRFHQVLPRCART